MKNLKKKSIIIVNQSYEAETLQSKLARIMKTGVGVEHITQELHYPEEYQPASDIRTDRFEVALNAKIASDRHIRKEAWKTAQNEKVENPITVEKNTEKTPE